MHPTGGSRRVFRAVSWLKVDSVKAALSRPAHPQVTQTVGQPVDWQGYNSSMAIVISLRDLVGEMQMLSDEHHVYLNKVTGELIMISDDDFRIAERGETDELAEWQEEIVQDAKKILSSDDYLEIPSKSDIHEYEIMERFCLSISDIEISDVLLGKIRGSGAFRRFKDTIYHYGLEQDWFKFRDNAYKEIAVSWLESNGLSYKDDLNESLQDK